MGDGYRAALAIWGALLAGVIANGVVVLALGPGVLPVDPSLAQVLGTFLLVAAAAETLLVWVMRQRLLETPATSAAWLRTWIVCWALAESIAVLGLVAATVASTPVPAPVFVVWGAALLLLQRPQPEHFPVAG